MPQPITTSARGLDFTPRFVSTSAVVASPAAAAETIIATLAIPEDVAVQSGVELVCFAAYTVGTNGVSGNLKIRRTNASGATVKATGALTVVAANLTEAYAAGLDAIATVAGQVYVATLTVASGSAESTVSAVYLRALVV